MASLSTKKLALGANKITVVYSGNADFTRFDVGSLEGGDQEPAPQEEDEEMTSRIDDLGRDT